MDVDSITRIIEDVGATEILDRFGALDPSDVRSKGVGDLVTTADVAAERALTARLTAAVPNSAVVGEEAVSGDGAILDALGGDQPTWVIDPIDGTWNYARNIPVFATLVAFVVAGQTVAAWIHDPFHRRTAVAEAGSGASLDGRMLATSNPSDQPLEITGAVYAGRFSTPELSTVLHRRKRRLRPIPTIACAGWEYLRLAGGGTDFAVFTRTMPWDHMAGILIHEEAGGWTRRFDGDRYRATEPNGPALLIAANETNWRQVHSALTADEAA